MLRTTVLLSLSLLVVPAVRAADKPTEPPPVKPGWTVLPDEVADGKVEEIVSEDDQLRVDELRERGLAKRIKVHFKSKLIPDYEILIRERKYDLDATNFRGQGDGVRGTRVWSLFDY